MNMVDCNEELRERMFKKEWTEIQTESISDQRRRQVESGVIVLSTNLKNSRVYMQYTPKGERARKVFTKLRGN